jgi:NitT/TauT family transport system ATP-binding protein
MTVLMVTHDLGEAFALGTRVLVFDKLRQDPTDPDAYGATIVYNLALKTPSTGPPSATAASRQPAAQREPHAQPSSSHAI